jgi:hypothetical protein
VTQCWAGDQVHQWSASIHLTDKVWKCVIQFEAFRIAENAHQIGPVSQIMQPVAFLN